MDSLKKFINKSKSSLDGHLTDKLCNIYENLAKYGIGLIIIGYANIIKEEQLNHGMMGIYEDSFIDKYKRPTDLKQLECFLMNLM